MDKLKTYTDNRGCLTIIEEGHEIPFDIQRSYWIYNVPQGAERGKHANKVSSQYLIAINGSLDVTLEDINGKRRYHLDSKDKGVLVPPHTWNELTNFSEDAVLLVFASHPYDIGTYINSYEEFIEFIKSK